MYIGHINLAKAPNGAGDHFVHLIDALQSHGTRQHVLVRNVTLARRLDALDDVTVGPSVSSAVMACCLMPHVDIVHVHGAADGQAGLLLTLTRSIPFVLTRRDELPGRNPVTQAIHRRASGIVYQGDNDAAKHLRIYRHALAAWQARTASR
ncbi:MAG: hypothetical protein HKN64_02610 [Woeseiaceae bacterium]|nr:hypothetical protein [Woeseiaceae bacterium]